MKTKVVYRTKIVYVTEMYSSNRTYTNCFKHIDDVCKYIRKRYDKKVSVFVFRMNVKLVNRMTNKELSKCLALRVAEYKNGKSTYDPRDYYSWIAQNNCGDWVIDETCGDLDRNALIKHFRLVEN